LSRFPAPPRSQTRIRRRRSRWAPVFVDHLGHRCGERERAADALLPANPFALLVAMLLNQQ
jgi:hypothetical protein